jgi:FkbM family methyltransferase
MGSTFREAFAARIKSDWRKVEVNNFDHHRFWQGATALSPLRRLALGIGLDRVRGMFRAAGILNNSIPIQWLYDKLVDDQSRQLLVAVLAYRALGRKHVRLPLNNQDYWRDIDMIEHGLLRTKCSQPVSGNGHLDDFDLAALGKPIRLRGRLMNVMNAFVLQQYRLERNGCVIEVENGDIVIDAGGCYGDTALYFADRVGPTGSVLCYEFDPENLEVFYHNMDANADISTRVRLIERAVWSSTGKMLSFVGNGPSTRLVAAGPGTRTVMTDTIDELTHRESVDKIDFIKMDIEGAELDALKGAEQTIRRHKPKLAISLYHRLEHFWQIPQFIDQLGLGYTFHIEHFTIHAEETMLFATVPAVNTG